MTPVLDESEVQKRAEFQALIFDLDDTLFDTTGLLITPAAHEMAKALKEAGLKGDVPAILSHRKQIIERQPRAEVIDALLDHFGVEEGQSRDKIREAGVSAFYARSINEDIHPYLGVPEMLMELKTHYNLYLVTLGSPLTQRRKLELLGLQSFFIKVFYVDISVTRGKQEALAEILLGHAQPSSTFLSIGNRLDTDLAPAKRLGMGTCWVRQGELRHMSATCAEEEPDYQIDRIQDLVRVCRL